MSRLRSSTAAAADVLAARVRVALRGLRGVDERRMFGGTAFLWNGHMICGALGDTLVLRLGADGAADALTRPHTRPMDFTGRPLKSMVYVDAAGHRRDRDLEAWLARAHRFALTLPPKNSTGDPRRARRRAARGVTSPGARPR